MGVRTIRIVVVVLSDPFRGMGARKKSAETQQSGRPKVWTRDQKWKIQPTSRPAPTFLSKKAVSFVVWEEMNMPTGIVSIEVGKNKGIKHGG